MNDTERDLREAETPTDPVVMFSVRLGETVGNFEGSVVDARWVLAYAASTAHEAAAAEGDQHMLGLAGLVEKVLGQETDSVFITSRQLAAVKDVVFCAADRWVMADTTGASRETVAWALAESWAHMLPGLGLAGLFARLASPVGQAS
jgi:hypothetical protein